MESQELDSCAAPLENGRGKCWRLKPCEVHDPPAPADATLERCGYPVGSGQCRNPKATCTKANHQPANAKRCKQTGRHSWEMIASDDRCRWCQVLRCEGKVSNGRCRADASCIRHGVLTRHSHELGVLGGSPAKTSHWRACSGPRPNPTGRPWSM
jgi:hypothetical protein